jgi:sugar lactone lactonase YvrE
MQAQKLLTCLFIVLMCTFSNENASAQYNYWSADGIIIAGNSQIGPPQDQELGHSSLSDTGLNAPYGICADAYGNVYIADFDNQRVQRWALGTNVFFGTTVVGQTGVSGSDNAHLNGPTGVAVDQAGDLFVTDYNNNRVMKYSYQNISGIANNGQTTSSLSGTVFAGGLGFGTTSQYVNNPGGIFITKPDDTVYVAEGSDTALAGHFTVLRFPPNSSSGTSGTIVAGGTHAHGTSATANNLNNPKGIYVDATTRDVYIADWGYSRVQRWSEPYSGGMTVAGGSQQQIGHSDSLLDDPCGVWLDAQGNLLVTDFGNNRIMEYLPGDTSGIPVLGVTSTTGFTGNLLGQPYGICLDSHGNLFVTDDGYIIAKEYSDSNTAVKTVKPLINNLNLYPNPNMGSFTLHSTVDVSLNGQQAFIVVMDINGKVVFSEKAVIQNGSVNKQIDMGDKIPNGVYQLQLVSGNNTAGSKFEIVR